MLQNSDFAAVRHCSISMDRQNKAQASKNKKYLRHFE